MEGRSKEAVVGQLLARATSEGQASREKEGDGNPARLRPSVSAPASPDQRNSAKARWGRSTAAARATGVLGAAAQDGLELGTRIWVEDVEHARAGQFGEVKELSNMTTVRVLFDDQWDGDKGEVVRRTAIIPASWRKKKVRSALIGAHAPRTPGSVERRKGGAAKRRDSTSSVSSRQSSSDDSAVRVARLQQDIMRLGAQLNSLEAEKTTAAKHNRIREAVQNQQQIDKIESEIQQKIQELGRLTDGVVDPLAKATASRERAAALIRSKYREFDRRRKQTALNDLPLLANQQQQAEQDRVSLEMQLRVAEETLQELQSELEAANTAAAAAKIQAHFRDRRARNSARSVLRTTSAHVRQLQAKCAGSAELENDLAAASAARIAAEQQHVELTEQLSNVEGQLRATELRELAVQNATSTAAAAAVEAVEKQMVEQSKAAFGIALETAQTGMKASVEAEASKNALLEAEIARLQEKLEIAATANLKQLQEMSERLATERANAQMHEQAALKAAAAADELRQAKATVDAELQDIMAEKDRLNATSTAQQESHDAFTRSIESSQDSLTEQLAEALSQKAILEAQMTTATSAFSSAQAEANGQVEAIEKERQSLATALSEITGAKEVVEADLASAMEELRVNIGAFSDLHGTTIAEQELAAATEEATQQRIRNGEEKLVLAQSAADAAVKLSEVHEEARKGAEERAATADALVGTLQQQAESVRSQLDAEKAGREELQIQLKAATNQRDEMAAEHLVAIDAMKVEQQDFAEAKLDEFHEILQKELVALTKLHEQEKTKREETESTAAKHKDAAQALAEKLASVEKDASDSAAEADVKLTAARQRYEAEHQVLMSELDAAKQEERVQQDAAEAQRQLEAIIQEKQQIEEQYSALSTTVQTISDTFKAQSDTAQSLHDAELQALRGTLESENLKAADEIQQLQASAAEDMQQKLAEMERQHLAARTLLSEQHTAAATIQAQRHRRMARRDVRAVMRAQHGSTEAASVEELESQLATMKSQHEDALSSVATRHSAEMDKMAASLVTDAALVAAEDHHASADEQHETVHEVKAEYEQQLAAARQRYEAEHQVLMSELEAAKQEERVQQDAAEAQRQLEAIIQEKQQIEEQY
eukprot:COSAG02_NODE_1686_length_11319_cov_78.896702_1_plen_1120_part_10